MPEAVTLSVNGVPVTVSAGTLVATAVMISGAVSFRKSINGEPRGLLCGMGVCFECRVTINGLTHCRSCQIPCQTGMDVWTDG